MAKPDTSYLGTLLEPARHVSILLPQKPSFDAVASALGLKLVLELSGRTVQAVCSDPMLVEFNRLVGVDSVSTAFGTRNLVISFPQQTQYVDKVSYNLEKDELQLVITPKPDAPELDYKRLKFISGISKTDLIILTAVQKLADLGSVYDDAKNHFQTTTLVSFSLQPTSENYTLHQFHDSQSSSLSELTTSVIDSLGMNMSADAASNLLAGMEKATQNFQSNSVTSDTFAAAAILMQHGAKRQFELSPADFPPGAIPVPPPRPPSPPPPPQPSYELGYGTDGTSPVVSETKKPDEKKTTPPDWYEPKIYKGPVFQ
jgi:hypothetical protein